MDLLREIRKHLSVEEIDCTACSDLEACGRAEHCCKNLGEWLDDYIARASAPQTREGWQLVPVEPTREMYDAATAEEKRGGVIETIWPAMLAAAPAAKPAQDAPGSPEAEPVAWMNDIARDGLNDCTCSTAKALSWPNPIPLYTSRTALLAEKDKQIADLQYKNIALAAGACKIAGENAELEKRAELAEAQLAAIAQQPVVGWFDADDGAFDTKHFDGAVELMVRPKI